MKKTAVLLVGFGGPKSKEEVRPFLENVLKGVRIPQQRFDEVVKHYEDIGSVSPYIPNTHKQAIALQAWLTAHGFNVPVSAGFRHSPPFFKTVFEQYQKRGIERVVAFVLAGFRSYPSWGKYLDAVEAGRQEAGAGNIEVEYTDEFYLDPLFIRAQIDRVKECGINDGTFYLFSAHSIPTKLSDESGYARQFEQCVAAIAQSLNLADWTVGYQSRSGSPQDPWLEPDLLSIVNNINTQKFSKLSVSPIGFLCENVEILYDLDVELKKACTARGLEYRRSSALNDHPLFTQMMGELVSKKL